MSFFFVADARIQFAPNVLEAAVIALYTGLTGTGKCQDGQKAGRIVFVVADVLFSRRCYDLRALVQRFRGSGSHIFDNGKISSTIIVKVTKIK